MRTLLHKACTEGKIRLLDLHLGLFLEQLACRETEQTEQPELLLAATLTSAAVGSGHVCLPLDQAGELSVQLDRKKIPAPDKWRQLLLASPVTGEPGETVPLILDRLNRLYLYRFFQYEQRIAADLLRRAAELSPIDPQQAGQLLGQLFPGSKKAATADYQQMAAAQALLKPLLVISGGPGTGKTHTVARILALIQALHGKSQQDNRLRIALAAPTGKAAARLEESIRTAKKSIAGQFAPAIPEKAQTLHRLLGYRPNAAAFRFNRNNPLPLDLLVLDEASMIDVVMMAALLEALPPAARLILLGDRNQLASVEAGSLFGDLCGSGSLSWSSRLCQQMEELTGAKELPDSTAAAAIADSVILLQTSYRFQDNSGIGRLAAAVNSGSVAEVDRVAEQDFPDLLVVRCRGRERHQWLEQEIIRGFTAMLTAPNLEQGFSAMEEFRFLCALRNGPAGVTGINRLTARVLRKAGLIDSDTEWYQGKPVIIRRNQYEMQLFNGDTGILWPDGEGRLRAWFKRADNSLYPVTPARLPEHDTAYAITIHKAQGSEFDRVLLLLPEEDSRVLSRELIYTGITRAKQQLTLCSDRTILHSAVQQRTLRYSGLADMLWLEPAEDTDSTAVCI
jgi:exodeoxyribonuclease V alpha subunit